MTTVSQDYLLLQCSDSLQKAVNLLGSDKKPLSGLILVEDSASHFVGLLNSADVLRLLAIGTSLDTS